MADKSNQLILMALSRAVAAAGTVPLHGNKSVAGLFPTNAAGKQAAQRCQEDGYLRLADAESPSASPLSPPNLGGDKGGEGVITLVKKKTASAPLCTITEKGLAYLLSQVSPRQVLEDFVRTLEARRNQADDLINAARQMQHGIEALKANVDKVLQRTYQVEGSTERGGAAGNLKALFAGFLNDNNASHSAPTASAVETGLDEAMLSELTRWQQAGASEDCPLPHLYRQASPRSIGQFHDALRQLHDAGKIYLHPWTGPLYDIPEPPYALLIGHEIAYYASIRK
ncbi:MAG: hypothetical protein ACYC3I_23065 [Gemmataceae bacterium]